MNIMAQNPYRTLGVFANSSMKDKKASTAKNVVFANVNKTATLSASLQG